MEMTTALVLFSFIAVLGYLANKLIDRKYGSKPNQELWDELYQLKAFQKDKSDNVEKLSFDLHSLQSSVNSELEKMSARIDGVQIKKAFNLDKQEVKHL